MAVENIINIVKEELKAVPGIVGVVLEVPEQVPITRSDIDIGIIMMNQQDLM